MGVVAEKLNAVKFAIMGDILQNINFAIKTGAVRDFLDNSVVAYKQWSRATSLRLPISQRVLELTPCSFRARPR